MALVSLPATLTARFRQVFVQYSGGRPRPDDHLRRLPHSGLSHARVSGIGAGSRTICGRADTFAPFASSDGADLVDLRGLPARAQP